MDSVTETQDNTVMDAQTHLPNCTQNVISTSVLSGITQQ